MLHRDDNKTEIWEAFLASLKYYLEIERHKFRLQMRGVVGGFSAKDGNI